MELSLNIEQLQLKSEYLHTNPKHIHYYEDNENPLFISWDNCITVLYSLNSLIEATLWNPIEPVILSISNPIVSVLTFDSNIYCIDNIGCIYNLKKVERDSPDLFDCSLLSQTSQIHQSSVYEWKIMYFQKCPCDVFGATYYSDGIALIAALGEWINIMLFQITINDNNEPIIFNICNKQIRLRKQIPFLVTSFMSCTWKDWFNSQRARELFQQNVLDCKDVFIIATEESKIYCTTSNINCKNTSLFLNYPQKIVHLQLCDLDSKKLLLVSSSGILTVIHCSESIPLSCTYLTVTKVIAVFIISQTIIVSDGVNLFLITFDNQFSKIIKQVVSPLKGVLSLHTYQINNIIAMTQLNKVYKLKHTYEVITQEVNLKLKVYEKSILDDIKYLYENIESLKEQHKQINEYINAVSITAQKNLVAQHCSFNILIYSGTKAMKLGASQDEYTFAIKLSINCSWLSFSSSIWKILIRVTDNKNTSSNCSLHSFNVDIFNNNNSLMIKHHLLTTTAKNCATGFVYCELVCRIKNDFINSCLVIPLSTIKLNALYFVKAEKQENFLAINPLEDQHKYVFKFPEHLSLLECLIVLTNKNKHRMSKSLYKNITENMPRTIYFNYFEKIVTMVLDDKITKTIILESIDRDALIAIRNGVLNHLSNNQPVIIQYSVLADIQKQLCLIEELSTNDRIDKNIIQKINTKIQDQISAHLPV